MQRRRRGIIDKASRRTGWRGWVVKIPGRSGNTVLVSELHSILRS